jgi:acylphosphatase
VQGVGFRMFVQEAAYELGLRGYVRNTSDGSVYVVACGDERRLRSLLGLLQRGPAMSHVMSVEEQWLDHDSEPFGPYFEVRG